MNSIIQCTAHLMNSMRPSSFWFGVGFMSLMLCNTGCQSLTTTKKWTWPWDSKNQEPQVPDRILPIWTDTIMHQPGKPGVRGFGGRVYFYAGEESQAIEVDGGLVVYVFDSDKMDPHSPSPEKKYVFTPEHMKNHMSEAPLGKSYSIWLPWDEVGGESRSLTLVARFEGTKGGVVLSQPAVKFLPGVAKKENLTSNAAKNDPNTTSSVQQAGYQSSSGEGTADRIRWSDPNDKPSAKEQAKRRETQTIDLPPSFYRHLNAPPGSPLADPFRDKSPSETSSSTESGSKPTQPNDTGTTKNFPTSESDSGSAALSPDQPPSTNALLRYPFRHIPGAEGTSTSNSYETTVSKTRPNRREPMKGGWIEGLPKTPRTP